MKVFLAHSKGTTDLEIQSWSTAVQRWFERKGEIVEVVPGVDDFNANIASDGTFDAWARAVPHRRDTFTGLRLYGAVVALSREVGKATGIIAQEALKAGTHVYAADWTGTDDVDLSPVAFAEETDPQDYFRGWELRTLERIEFGPNDT
jgi:hypothetical protein